MEAVHIKKYTREGETPYVACQGLHWALVLVNPLICGLDLKHIPYDTTAVHVFLA